MNVGSELSEDKFLKVFWSWQSDIPGKIGRHFVRQALKQAIEAIKAEEMVLEPSARELHLDHDRKNVPGSPDLAGTIFSKIDEASVFIADVTPIAKAIENTTNPDKMVINPNVAIELGYALKSVGDTGVLMVLNRQFGNRGDLPFDLRHKAGPLEFNLSPEASKDEIAAELRRFVGDLKVALRPYIKKPLPKTHVGFQPDPASGVYFEKNEELGRLGEEEDGDFLKLHHSGDKYFSLRLIPNETREIQLPRHELVAAIRQAQLAPFGRESVAFWQANKFGAIALDPKNNNNSRLDASTQAFGTGELWGVSEYLLVDNDRGKFIPTGAVAESLNYSIRNYGEFALNSLGTKLPFDLEFSAKGLADYGLVVKDFMGHRRAKIHGDKFTTRLTVQRFDDESITEVVREFMSKLFDAAGLALPNEYQA